MSHFKLLISIDPKATVILSLVIRFLFLQIGSFIVFPLSKQTEGPMILLNKYLRYMVFFYLLGCSAFF